MIQEAIVRTVHLSKATVRISPTKTVWFNTRDEKESLLHLFFCVLGRSRVMVPLTCEEGQELIQALQASIDELPGRTRGLAKDLLKDEV